MEKNEVYKDLVMYKDQTGNSSEIELLESGFRRRRNRIPGHVVANPEWLPLGWITEIKVRQYGYSAGRIDKMYINIANDVRCRSRREVMRYLEYHTNSSPLPTPKRKPRSSRKAHRQPAISLEAHTQTQIELSSCQCCQKPVYYHRPVICESPLYAEHPGLYPVVYLPVIGDSEDRFKPPPVDFIGNMQLKPLLSRPVQNIPLSNPSPVSCRRELFNEAFGPPKDPWSNFSKRNPWQKFAENVPESNQTPRLDCGLSAQNSGKTNSLPSCPVKPVNNNAVDNPFAPPTSLTMSCNNSPFAAQSVPVWGNRFQFNPLNSNPSRCSVAMAAQNQGQAFNA